MARNQWEFIGVADIIISDSGSLVRSIDFDPDRSNDAAPFGLSDVRDCFGELDAYGDRLGL